MHVPFLGGNPSATRFSPSPQQTQDGQALENITGKFDPTALERGAKALKELDNSPNASKAFEITKLQELTKQKEIQKDMEQLHTQRTQIAAEKARIEAAEKRKTIDHQQEQERVTAQYKAQLEAEAYSKKLQDQQKQNEEWLYQQHQQFMRQEEIRKRTEMEMLEMKKQQLREERAAEKELLQARIQQEIKGRILQERENIDIHLRTLRAKAAEDRKTRLDVINTIFDGSSGAFNSIIGDKTKLMTFIGSITALSLGIYGARMSTNVVGKYIESRIGKPRLVRETSRKLFNFQKLSQYLPWSKKSSVDLMNEIVLPPDLSERLQWSINATKASVKNNFPFRHMCLYGSPGTGKTLFAKMLAKESGLDYAIMTGGDISPLGKSASAELNKLFDWSKKTKNGLILFIDEADAFLRKGRGDVSPGFSEDLRNALSTFLHHTGSESYKFCIVLATNCKDIIDKAVLDRMDEVIEFPLPGVEERERMLKIFMDKYIFTPMKEDSEKIVVDSSIDDSFIHYMATKTIGFSGRQLAKLCIGMQAAVFGSGTNVLTKGLAELVLNWKIAVPDPSD